MSLTSCYGTKAVGYTPWMLGLGLTCIPSLVFAQPVSNGFDFPVGDANGGGWNHTAGWSYLEWTGSVYHPGDDLNKNGTSGNGDLNEPVYAVSNGRVIYAANAGSGWGNIILIEHLLPDGRRYWSQYAHLQTIEVTVNSDVTRRQFIGRVGNAGGEYVAHLHFEIREIYRDAPAWVAGWTVAQVESHYDNPRDFINGHRQLGAPTIVLENLPPERWYRTNVTLPWRVINGSGSWAVNEYIGGQHAGGPYSSGTGFINLAARLGWHTSQATVTQSGQTNSSNTWTGGFDNVLPSASRTGGINPTTWYRGSQTVTYTGTDAHSGFRDSQWWWEGQGSQGWNSTNPRQVSVPTASGKYRLHVEVADNAWTDPGNSSTNSSGDLFLGEFWIDNTNPTVPTIALTPTNPNGLNGWYITRPTANFSATDPGPFSSGAPTTFFSVNGGTYVQGSSLLVADGITSVLTSYARDPVQNDSPISAPTTVKVDTTPPNNPTLEDEGLKRPDGTILQVSITGGGDPESGANVVEYLVSDSANPGNPLPAWGIGPKQAPFTGKRFAIEGLNIPDGEQVFVLARQRNSAGLWSQWGASDGILIDRSAFPENLTAFLFSSGTSEGTQGDWTLEGSLGETIVFGHDSNLVVKGFWAMALPFLVHPDAVTVTSGEEFQGNLDSLLSSDDDRYLAFNDPTSLATVIEQLLYMPISDGTKLAIRYESAVARPGLAENLQCFNVVTTTWVVLSGRVAPTTDSVANWSVATGIAPYVSESNQLKVRFFWHPINDEDPAQDGWLCSLDLTECEITP